MCEKYNGWTNYETWCVNLWMDNSPGAQEYWQFMASGANSVHDLAFMIQSGHEDLLPELSGVFSDLLSAGLSSVNWDEIAGHIWEEYQENKEEICEFADFDTVCPEDCPEGVVCS